MATNFPISLDSFVNPQADSLLATISHSQQHTNANDAIEAIETLIGVNGSTELTTIQGQLRKTRVSLSGTEIGTGPLNFVTANGAGWSISNEAGVITIAPSLPQDLQTTATPTFAGLTLTNQVAQRLIFAGTGGDLIQSANLTFNNNTNVLTVANGQANISRNDGGGNFALDVSHGGGSVSRMGARIATTGTNSNTTAFVVNTGSLSNALIVDGSGNSGIGIAPVPSVRTAVQGSGTTNATEALRILNSAGTILAQFQNNGYLAMGGTSNISRLTVVNTQTDSAVGGVQAQSTFTGTDATGRTNYGILGNCIGSTSVSASHVGYGGQFLCTPTVSSGAVNSGNNAGILANGSINSASHAGTQTNLFAGYFRHGATSAATGGGTITNSLGNYILTDFSNPPSLAITNSYGLQIVGTGTASYPTNVWGIWEGYSAATNAANYFANPIQIGTTIRGANFLLSRDASAASWGAYGINSRFNSATFTDTSTVQGATVTHNAVNSFGGGVLAATNSGVTYTNAYTLHIAGAPSAGTNATIANPWALSVGSGNSRFVGNISVGIGQAYDADKTNASLLSGGNNSGIQIRGGATYLPTIEFFRYSAAVGDGTTVGRISAYAGVSTVNELSRIETLAVGAAENAGSLVFSTATGGVLNERMRIESTGRTVIQQINLPNTSTPASATAAGTTGDIAWDVNYIYVCVGPSQWKRTALSTW